MDTFVVFRDLWFKFGTLLLTDSVPSLSQARQLPTSVNLDTLPTFFLVGLFKDESVSH